MAEAEIYEDPHDDRVPFVPRIESVVAWAEMRKLGRLKACGDTNGDGDCHLCRGVAGICPKRQERATDG